MRNSPSIVPDPDNRDIYLVLDDFAGHLGRAWPETDDERTDREIVITELKALPVGLGGFHHSTLGRL